LLGLETTSTASFNLIKMNEQSSGFKLEYPIFHMGPRRARNVKADTKRFTAHNTRIGEGNICLKRAEPSEGPMRLSVMKLCDIVNRHEATKLYGRA
jgi:hypothetical protein